jgi:thioredoxin reductase
VEDRFVVTLADGMQESTRKLLLTTGVRDELPEIEGFAEFWGRGVFHCPYCHGWEVRDQPLAIYGKGEEGLEQALLLTNWSRDLVLCSDGPVQLSEQDRNLLAKQHIPLREEAIARLEGTRANATVSREDQQDALERIVFINGEILPRRGLFIHPNQHQHSPLAEKLGCTMRGGIVKVAANGWTGIPHLYMAGDATIFAQQMVLAAGSGVRAALGINVDLLQEDLT